MRWGSSGDDGGSSGVLRRELGVQPPGDIRNCLAALAREEPLLTKLFQYRFTAGSGVEGHSFGNLFISALTAITGSLETAITASSKVLAVQGQVAHACQVRLHHQQHVPGQPEQPVHHELRVAVAGLADVRQQVVGERRQAEEQQQRAHQREVRTPGPLGHHALRPASANRG